jgi:hypothetical protein
MTTIPAMVHASGKLPKIAQPITVAQTSCMYGEGRERGGRLPLEGEDEEEVADRPEQDPRPR